MTCQSPHLIVQRAALRFEVQSARTAVLNTYMINRTAPAEQLEAACLASLTPLCATLVACLDAPPLDAATIGMVRCAVLEMATRFAKMKCGAALQDALRERVERLIDQLPTGRTHVEPAVQIVPPVKGEDQLAPTAAQLVAAPAVQSASQDEIEILAIIDGPGMRPRSLQLDSPIAVCTAARRRPQQTRARRPARCAPK